MNKIKLTKSQIILVELIDEVNKLEQIQLRDEKETWKYNEHDLSLLEKKIIKEIVNLYLNKFIDLYLKK